MYAGAKYAKPSGSLASKAQADCRSRLLTARTSLRIDLLSREADFVEYRFTLAVTGFLDGSRPLFLSASRRQAHDRDMTCSVR
jgi:hypothetical protein